MVEAALAPKTFAYVPTILPDSDVVQDVLKAPASVKGATSFAEWGYRAEVATHSAASRMVGALQVTQDRTADPETWARQSRVLSTVQPNMSAKNTAIVAKEFAAASLPSFKAPAPKNELAAFLALPQKVASANRLQVKAQSPNAAIAATAATRLTKGGPAAFGRSGFSGTLAQGSRHTYRKDTNSRAALRGPVAARMPLAESVSILNAARKGPAFRPAPIFAPAPVFTASSAPNDFGVRARAAKPSFGRGGPC